MEKDEADLLEQKAHEVIASKKLVSTSRGPIWFFVPTLDDKLLSRHFYEVTLQQKKDEGVPTAEESLAEFIEQGLWSEEKDKNLAAYPDMIKEMEERIANETRNRAKRIKLEKWLEKLNEQYLIILQDRNTRLANCAEFLAHDAATLYLLWASAHSIDGNKLWPSFDAIENDFEVEWIDELLYIYLEKMQNLSEAEVRAISRSSIWRIRWNAFKQSSFELFGRHSQNLSSDQFLLVHWSQVYDSVYESMERPPESVIKDDEALDKWLLTQHEERTREIGQRYHGKGTQSNSKIDNANEVFKIVTGEFDENGVWREYTDKERWEKIEAIRNLNSPLARKIKSNEEERLKQTPYQFIQEHELRKNKDHREAMGGTVTMKRSK
jgi:hypothetical protein